MIVPPKFANRILEAFCKEEYLEDIQGDLEEEFAMKAPASALKAKIWYFLEVIKLIRPTLIKQFQPFIQLLTETTMFRNYLKIGFRNLTKYKSSTMINISGLTVGIAAFLLIALFVKDEISYDQHHEHAEDVYRLTVKNFDQDGSISRQWAFASAGHAQRFKSDYPEVTHAVRFFAWAFPDLRIGEKVFPGEMVVFADQDVFDVFTFPFIIGNPNTAFNEVKSLVLTESSAVRLFGSDWESQDILGKSVDLSRDGMSAPFQITGVMQDMPEQQHFHFEYLAPIQFIEQLFGKNAMNNVTGNYNWLTYLRLQPGTDPKVIEDRKDEFFDKYVGKTSNGQPAKDGYDFELQPLASIHLHSNLEGEIESNGSIQQIYIFSVVGILLLLVACINYMNLATSQFSRRMKEIGVRKVVGARKMSLIHQFLTESFIINIIAFPLAILMAWLALPYLNEFMGKTLTLDLLQNAELFGGLILLMLIVTLMAGLYPAMFMAKIQLLQALKGESAIRSNRWNFRYWLVTFQYAVTIGLIFTLAVIKSQMQFINNSDPGYQKDQIIHLWMSNKINNLDVFKHELLQHPDIKKATYASRVPTGRLADSWNAAFFQNDSAVQTSFRLPFILADEDFLSTFEIPLIAGENFSKDMNMTRDSVGYYLINRTAAEALGFNNPRDIIGKKLSYGQYNDQQFKAGRILGVTEDFHFESLHSEITPMIILKDDWKTRKICLQVDTKDIPSVLEHVETTWAQFDMESSPQYRFLDEIFAEQYEAEERLSTMISSFTFIAIFIGCLGLIGMVGFIINTKYKEIGVRKVLGASILSIVMMISKQFLILVGIAFAAAIPIAFYFISGWLNDFVYHVNISLWIILLPALGALIITFITIGYQTLKASMINPVEYLQDE